MNIRRIFHLRTDNEVTCVGQRANVKPLIYIVFVCFEGERPKVTTQSVVTSVVAGPPVNIALYGAAYALSCY